METESDEGALAAYDRYGEAYRKWWAPIIAPSAVRLLDRLEGVAETDAAFSILDVGVGTGTLAISALERWPAATAIGVDPSQVMLGMAAERARRRGGAFAGRLRLLLGSAERLPVADASVDLALTSFVIQLLPHRLPALREMHRVVRPGGVVALMTWQAHAEPFAPDEIVQDTFDELDIPETQGGGDPRPYTSPRAAAAEFRRIGYRDVHADLEWLEHQFTPQSYLDLVEHWTEADTIVALPASRQAELRRRLVDRLERLETDVLCWRRPLVSVVARRT